MTKKLPKDTQNKSEPASGSSRKKRHRKRRIRHWPATTTRQRFLSGPRREYRTRRKEQIELYYELQQEWHNSSQVMSNHETQDSIKGATTTSEENFCRKGEDEIEQKNTHQNEENVEYNYENRTTLQENHPPTTTTEKNNFDNKLENDSLFEESPMSQENSLSNSSQCMESKNQNSSLNQKNQNPAPSKKKNKMSKKKQSISSKKVQSKSKENTRINSNLKDNSTKKKRKKRTQLVKVKKSQNPLHKNV